MSISRSFWDRVDRFPLYTGTYIDPSVPFVEVNFKEKWDAIIKEIVERNPESSSVPDTDKPVVCECGSEKCGSPSHSKWCPKWKE